MEIKRCEKGHFYDAEANSTCPQCAAEMEMEAMGKMRQTGYNQNVEDYGPTEPVGPMNQKVRNQGVEDYGSTEPVGPMNQKMHHQGVEDYGPTESADVWQRFNSAQQDSSAGYSESYDDMVRSQEDSNRHSSQFSPVAGWLACIEGPEKGSDHRIRTGYNYMGRSEHMDICIRGDKKISRERHALIAYDHKENVFFFGPADGKSIVRVNDKMVMTPVELHPYDVLTVGDTQLMFIPLCGERFIWK